MVREWAMGPSQASSQLNKAHLPRLLINFSLADDLCCRQSHMVTYIPEKEQGPNVLPCLASARLPSAWHLPLPCSICVSGHLMALDPPLQTSTSYMHSQLQPRTLLHGCSD